MGLWDSEGLQRLQAPVPRPARSSPADLCSGSSPGDPRVQGGSGCCLKGDLETPMQFLLAYDLFPYQGLLDTTQKELRRSLQERR